MPYYIAVNSKCTTHCVPLLATLIPTTGIKIQKKGQITEVIWHWKPRITR